MYQKQILGNLEEPQITQIREMFLKIPFMVDIGTEKEEYSPESSKCSGSELKSKIFNHFTEYVDYQKYSNSSFLSGF